ncbi:MAG: hypothetical protein ACMXYF_04695 [Candidatus Woesearchaeota archaeon]
MKCVICAKPAVYFIKGTTTAYCEEHAKECFADTTYLANVEEHAKQLKQVLDSQIDQLETELEKLNKEHQDSQDH